MLSWEVITGALCGIRTETDIAVMPSGLAHLSSPIECFHGVGRSQRKVTLEKTPDNSSACLRSRANASSITR